MKRSIWTKAKTDQATATLEFRCRSGSVYAFSENFKLANSGEEELMRVTNFYVSSTYSGANANVIGIRKTHHLGYCRSHRRSLLRIFRRLVQARLDDPEFRKKLRDHNAQAAYEEAVERVRELKKQLVSAKSDLLAVVQEMVTNKKLKPQPMTLPLIK